MKSAFANTGPSPFTSSSSVAAPQRNNNRITGGPNTNRSGSPDPQAPQQNQRQQRNTFTFANSKNHKYRSNMNLTDGGDTIGIESCSINRATTSFVDTDNQNKNAGINFNTTPNFQPQQEGSTFFLKNPSSPSPTGFNFNSNSNNSSNNNTSNTNSNDVDTRSPSVIHVARSQSVGVMDIARNNNPQPLSYGDIMSFCNGKISNIAGRPIKLALVKKDSGYKPVVWTGTLGSNLNTKTDTDGNTFDVVSFSIVVNNDLNDCSEQIYAGHVGEVQLNYFPNPDFHYYGAELLQVSADANDTSNMTTSVALSLLPSNNNNYSNNNNNRNNDNGNNNNNDTINVADIANNVSNDVSNKVVAAVEQGVKHEITRVHDHIGAIEDKVTDRIQQGVQHELQQVVDTVRGSVKSDLDNVTSKVTSDVQHMSQIQQSNSAQMNNRLDAVQQQFSHLQEKTSSLHQATTSQFQHLTNTTQAHNDQLSHLGQQMSAMTQMLAELSKSVQNIAASNNHSNSCPPATQTGAAPAAQSSFTISSSGNNPNGNNNNNNHSSSPFSFSHSFQPNNSGGGGGKDDDDDDGNRDDGSGESNGGGNSETKKMQQNPLQSLIIQHDNDDLLHMGNIDQWCSLVSKNFAMAKADGPLGIAMKNAFDSNWNKIVLAVQEQLQSPSFDKVVNIVTNKNTVLNNLKMFMTMDFASFPQEAQQQFSSSMCSQVAAWKYNASFEIVKLNNEKARANRQPTQYIDTKKASEQIFDVHKDSITQQIHSFIEMVPAQKYSKYNNNNKNRKKQQNNNNHNNNNNNSNNNANSSSPQTNSYKKKAWSYGNANNNVGKAGNANAATGNRQ